MDKLHPGVYIQEIPSGVKPIEGVSTSTAAFIGKAEMGPLGKANLVTSFSEFQASYGSYLSDSYLAHSVFQFFNNGGRKTYVVRVAGVGAGVASVGFNDRKTTSAKTLTVRAANEGTWGNTLDIGIVDSITDPTNLFSMQVYRDRSDLNPPLPPLLLETIADVSMDPAAPNFVRTVVTAKSKYISVQEDTANQATAPAGFSRGAALAVGNGADVLKLGVGNGGTEVAGVAGPPATSGTSTSAASPSTNPPADKRKLNINLDSDGPREIVIPQSATSGADVANTIQMAVRGLKANTPAKQSAYDGFTCTFGTTYVLTSGSKGLGSTVAVTNSVATPIQLLALVNKFRIRINGDGPHELTLAGPITDGSSIQQAINTAVRGITARRSANQTAFNNFSCNYDVTPGPGNPSFLLTSGVAGTGSRVEVTNGTSPSQDVAQTLKLGATNMGIEVSGAAILRPAVSTAAPDGGADGATPQDADYMNGLSILDVIRDVNIVAIPGITSAAVVDAGSNYCTQRADCFFIGDIDRNDMTFDAARIFVSALTVKSSYGAVYYPWLLMTDPTGASAQPVLTPPSGYVAGMYARIDSTRGVFKAPAGTEANIGGAVGLAATTTDAQQDFLNPIGLNVIRSFPASGIVIWGARTLATLVDPEYRYIPVRRTAIFLEQSIYNGIQYAVFEPNDTGLWSSLRLNINAFMMLQFRAGAFQGKTPTEAFFVKVDETTTTQADIDAGTVNILVGFAPLKPAEFVVLQLTQKVNQAAA
jgi:phage tail sheath protein FI